MSSTMTGTVDSYQHALALARQGDLQRAESICQDILRRQAAHSEALLLLGVIELQTGRTLQAAASFGRSIEIDPSQPLAQALHGDALLDCNRPEEALHSYNRGLQLAPGLSSAHLGRGNALLDLHRPLEALASYDEFLRLEPHNAEAQFNRGNALLELKRYAEAIAGYGRAIDLNPPYPAALCNRGSALRALRQLPEAIENFDRALQARSDFLEALCARGDTLLELGRAEEALEAHEHAVSRRPDYRDAHLGCGNSLLALRRFADALARYEEARRLDPLHASTHHHCGNALVALGRRTEALASFERAIELQDDHAQALRSRGDLLLALQRPEAAAASFVGLLQADATAENAAGALLHAKQWCADWSASTPAASRDNVVQAVLAGQHADSPFSFLAVADSAEAQLRCAQTFIRHRVLPATPLWNGGGYGHERIRLAYVSADFRAHPVSYLMAGIFERHDRRRFEIVAISLRPPEKSAWGERVENAFDRFIDVSARSDRQTAELMHGMHIDIAVDLTGFTDGLRPQIFAQRPAPIQVNYLGYPGTLGAPYMDYLLADEFVIPPSRARHYAECVVYLPDSFQANDDQRPIGTQVPTRAEAGLPESAFVYCCFNNTYKLNPTLFDLWMRLLHQVPGSVLWLLATAETAAENLRREAAGRGIDPLRLVFAARQPNAEHLARLSLADLFLDTLPFNAGASASDALWAGVPVLSCAGEAFAARMGGSILQAAGLTELIAHDLAQYEAKALSLAQRPESLRELRRRWQARRNEAPLFNTDRCRRHLESAFERMWRLNELGKKPESFAVNAAG